MDACLLRKEDNIDGQPMNHEVADPADVENNGWKFGWKFEGEEHPIPEWPNYKVSNCFTEQRCVVASIVFIIS